MNLRRGEYLAMLTAEANGKARAAAQVEEARYWAACWEMVLQVQVSSCTAWAVA